MKKIFFVMVLAIVGLATASAQLKIGVKAGMNTSTISEIKTLSYTGVNGLLGWTSNVSYKAGFHVGLTARYLFADALGVETGLFYSQIGGRIKMHADFFEQTTMDVFETFNPSYLQLPVQLLYKIDLGLGLALVPSAGIYVGYGLGGKVGYKAKASTSQLKQELEEEIALFDKSELFKPKSEGGKDLNRFDYGATFGLNVEYQKFTIGVGYDLGLARLNKEAAPSGYKDLKNGNIKVSIGLFF